MEKPKYPGKRVTMNGNQLVALTEARIADCGVFYPITPSTEQGENFEMSVAQGNLTVFGESVRAIEAEGEHAAQGGAIAISLLGKRVSNFTSGQGIVYGLEQYYHAPGKLSTMVLNVGARALTKHALNVHCGHDDIMSALDTGWIMMMAKDAQQAVDQTIILRRVTELSLTPAMNVQDGFLTTHLERTFLFPESELLREYLGHPSDIIDTPTEAQRELFGPRRRRIPIMFDLKAPAILGSVQNQEHYMTGIISRRIAFCDPLLSFVEEAQKEFGCLTGRHYGFVSEYNCKRAQTVFLSLGSSAENIEAACDYIRETHGEEVGVIHLNLIRPFPERAIIESLRNKKNVIILERTDDPTSGSNPLSRDVRTAISKAIENSFEMRHADLPALKLSEAPRIFEGVYGLGSRDFRPEGILGAYEFMTGRIARQDGKWAKDGESFFYIGANHPYEVKSQERPSLLPKGAIAVRIHSIGGWGAITTGKNIAGILGDLGPYSQFAKETHEPVIHISANPKYGSEKKGAPTNYFLVVARERIRVNCDLKHVDVVLCCDPKIFTHTDPLEGLKEGGHFVWESGLSPAQAWQRIPVRYRQEIHKRNIQVSILDGFRIARDHTPREDLQTRMQGNAFLGAFFRVSRFLKDHNIQTETFFEVVHKQYQKKFGKLGEAVIASNMDVMKAGFQGVKSIQLGAIDDLDESAMKGRVILPIHEKSLSLDCEGKGQLPPIFRADVYQREYLEAFKGEDQKSSPLASVGPIPAGTGGNISKFVSRIRVPVYNPYNCTQCMACLTVCPDTALPNTVQSIENVLKGVVDNYVTDSEDQIQLKGKLKVLSDLVHQSIKSEIESKSISTFREIFLSHIEATVQIKDQSKDELVHILSDLPLGYGKSKPAFQLVEKSKPGEGGLFMIFVSDLCKGCGECVEACGDHNALTMAYESDLIRGQHLSAMEFYKELPRTDEKYLGSLDPQDLTKSKAAILQNHLLVQDHYQAFIGGDGSCAGCGEKSVLRGVVTITQAFMEPLFKRKSERLRALADQLKAEGMKALKRRKEHSMSDYQNLRDAILHIVLRYGGETASLSRSRIQSEFKGGDQDLIVALVKTLLVDHENHKGLNVVKGEYQGMAVMGMAASTGCNTVYGSTHPANPHAYPWVNSLFQDGPTVGWLLAEGFVMESIRNSILPERLSKRLLGEELAFSEKDFDQWIHLGEGDLTESEILELPKVWVVGGDGALGDIGFQNLSKAVLQNRPNLQMLMLDTQVYSNTGGQNSDSSLMPGGFDMNQFSPYHEGKMTERKEVAQILTSGHGSPYVASVSMASSASFYKSVLDGLTYRGTAFLQAFTTCQPEHGVGDHLSAHQARAIRDSRGAPEFVFDPAQGETETEAFSLKGNPQVDRDWMMKKQADGQSYPYTVVQWAATEGRFRNHFYKLEPSDEVVDLLELLPRITQHDVVCRRYLDPKHRSHIPMRGVYCDIVNDQGKVKRWGISRQMVLFCIERRRNWRRLQSKAGIKNQDYENQKALLGES